MSDVVRGFIGGAKDGNTVVLAGNTTQALDLAAHVIYGVVTAVAFRALTCSDDA